MLQIRLIDVDSVALVERKGSLTVVLQVEGQDDLLMRRAEDVRDWFELLQRILQERRERSKIGQVGNLKTWLEARERIGRRYQYKTERDRGRETLSMERGHHRRAHSECNENINTDRQNMPFF